MIHQYLQKKIKKDKLEVELELSEVDTNPWLYI